MPSKEYRREELFPLAYVWEHKNRPGCWCVAAVDDRTILAEFSGLNAIHRAKYYATMNYHGYVEQEPPLAEEKVDASS